MTQTFAPDQVLSLLVIVNDNHNAVQEELPKLHAFITARYKQFEVVCVDNGTTDGSQAFLLGCTSRLSNMRYIRLTQSYSKEIAIACALEQSIGDVAVIFDTYTDCIDQIPDIVERALKGAVVLLHRPTRDGFAAQIASKMFYFFARKILRVNLLSSDYTPSAFTRSALVSITKIKNRRRNLSYFNAMIGMKSEIVEAAETPRSFSEGIMDKMYRGIDLLITNSSRPLRFVSLLGVGACITNLAYLIYIVLVAIFKNHVAEGWITLSTVMSFMFLFIFLILTVLCEYIGRILEEVQERPLYFIEFEKDGAIAIANKVLNVV